MSSRHYAHVRGSPSSSHPFLVDQTPYIQWDARSSRSPSSSSSYISRSSRSPSTSSTASSSSLSSRPWIHRAATLGPAAPIRAPPPPPRRASASTTSYRSPPTPPTRPLRPRGFSTPRTVTPGTPRTPATPTTPNWDPRCDQFMKNAEQQEYYFGSVAARVSPKGVRRELLPHLEDAGVEVLEVYKPLPPLPGEARSCR